MGKHNGEIQSAHENTFSDTQTKRNYAQQLLLSSWWLCIKIHFHGININHESAKINKISLLCFIFYQYVNWQRWNYLSLLKLFTNGSDEEHVMLILMENSRYKNRLRRVWNFQLFQGCWNHWGLQGCGFVECLYFLSNICGSFMFCWKV